MIKELMEWLKAIVSAIIIVFIFNIFFAITTVYNTSMVPTLTEGNMLFISKISSVELGDIVTFETDIHLTAADIQTLSPIKRIFVSEETKKNLIKRVIAGPGDSIEIKDGEVWLNGELMTEPYIHTVTGGDVSIAAIPDGYYFMMGDNRAVSLDSRSDVIGLISEDRIIGEVVFRFWPIFEWASF